jgi:molybdenum cofactor biosynthesis enzyme
MCKAMSKSIEITDIHLISKSGGKSDDYVSKRSKNGR